jgi:hypothetical protein
MGTDGLKEVLALGPLAVAVTVFLAVVIPAEGARTELVTEDRIGTPFCSIFPVEEFVVNDFCYPRLLGVGALCGGALKLAGRHRKRGGRPERRSRRYRLLTLGVSRREILRDQLGGDAMGGGVRGGSPCGVPHVPLAREEEILHELASGESVSSKPREETGWRVEGRGRVRKIVTQFKRGEVGPLLSALRVTKDVMDRCQIVLARAKNAGIERAISFVGRLTNEGTAAGVELLNRTHAVAVDMHGITLSGLMEKMSDRARPSSRQKFHSICRGKPYVFPFSDVDHKAIGLGITAFFKDDRTRCACRGVAEDPCGLGGITYTGSVCEYVTWAQLINVGQEHFPESGERGWTQ